MPGTITRLSIAEAKFCTLANGNETATLVYIGPINNDVVAFYVRWKWDDNFTALAGYALESDETTLIKEILTSANLWDSWMPTWRQLETDADPYIDAQGNEVHGGQAVAKRYSDAISTIKTKDLEAATDQQWFHGIFLPEIQTFSDQVYIGLVTPPEPTPPPPPAAKYPPNAIGQITTAMTLADAQASRIISVRDTANGNRPVIGAIPVPT